MKMKFLKAVITVVVLLTFGGVCFAVGGSIGYGDISVYKNDKLVAKLKGKNPVEDGSLLVCDGRCMIKSEGISLVGQAETQVAVASEEETFKIYVKEGRVDFIINNNVRTISFRTPQDTYTVAEAVFNAGSTSAVKGSILVDKSGKTEISVSEGRLVFATKEGMKVVDANKKIVLAVVPGGESMVAPLVVLGSTAGVITATATGGVTGGDSVSTASPSN